MEKKISNNILFIDEEELKSMVPSTRNLGDTQTIYYATTLSQINNIKNVMGRDFYEDMVSKYTDYVDNGIDMEEHYDFLMDYHIKPILALYVYKRLILHTSFKLKEGGLRTSISADSELVTPSERGEVTGQITNDINDLIENMKYYIYDNSSYFPLFEGDYGDIYNEEVNLMIGKVQDPGLKRKF